MFKLRDWIDESNLSDYLSCNPRAIKYLEENPDMIDWFLLSRNPEAVSIIEKTR
jgi:hypothetical protein